MAVAECLGYNPACNKFEVLVKSGKVKKDNEQCVIRRFDNDMEADVFVRDVNQRGVPDNEFFSEANSGFAPVKKQKGITAPVFKFLDEIMPVAPGCDLPEQGGISGNLNKNRQKAPYICYIA